MTRASGSARAARQAAGVIFTQRWMVNLILDLVGYDTDQDLLSETIIDPACGDGAFLEAIVERLLARAQCVGTSVKGAEGAVLAFDIDVQAVESARQRVKAQLTRHGVHSSTATRLVKRWIRQEDFLLAANGLPKARWVVGNPPYVRLEHASPALTAAYRQNWDAMTGRADLYIGFYQAALSLLGQDGSLGFICADRWMRNKYGANLRRLVEERYALDICIGMHEVDAFDEKVNAYPALTVLRRGTQGPVLAGEAHKTFTVASAERLTQAWRDKVSEPNDQHLSVAWVAEWHIGRDIWPAGLPHAEQAIAKFENKLPTLSEARVKISVGVATGADDVFFVSSQDGIEPDRLALAVGAKDIADGSIKWPQRWLVNPWDSDGVLLDLTACPQLSAYLHAHQDRLKARHIVKKNPSKWWRTIDRVDPAITGTPKLLIPDVKNYIHPVLDTGRFIPMHNLYYATSTNWDLEVLGGILLSDIANAFIHAYSVRMANGYYRVSAQYLRKVRVPHYRDIDDTAREQLRQAFRKRDRTAASAVAERVYRAAAG